MKKRFIALALSISMLTAALSGCAPQTPAQTPAVSAPAAEVSASPTKKPQETIRGDFVVTDMAGREVTIPAEVKSIATFGSVGVLNAFVELMGSGNLLCNQMPANFTKSDKWKMQYEFAPQIKDAPLLVNADGELLLEEILNPTRSLYYND